MSKTFWLFTTVLLAILLQESSSAHLKTKAQKVQAQYQQTGVCFMTMYQSGDIFKFSKIYSDNKQETVSLKHGQCKDVSYVGDNFNDDMGYVKWTGDCKKTCSVEVFDDADFRGDSKRFYPEEKDMFTELNDWEDRVSSLRICCGTLPGFEYKYLAGCDFNLRRGFSWSESFVPPELPAHAPGGGCQEVSYVGKTYNDNVDQVTASGECADCTVQFFDDADYKGGSKTWTVGSSEFPFNSWLNKMTPEGWKDRVSSFKVCCPERMKTY